MGLLFWSVVGGIVGTVLMDIADHCCPTVLGPLPA